MTGEYLTAPGLLAHVFLRAGGQDARAEWQRLRFLWYDVTGRLGFDRPVPLLAVASHLPREPAAPAEEFGLLAAAERDEASVWQASAWTDHGILGLTVMMAPSRDRDCSGAWTDLEQAWGEAVAGLAPNGVLGEVRIFLALLASPSPDRRAGPGRRGVRASSRPGPRRRAGTVERRLVAALGHGPARLTGRRAG